MKTKTILFCLSVILIVQFMTGCTQRQEKPALAQVKPVEDEYFGKKISDPYRYMEDLKDPEVQKWIKSQADYSRSVLNSIPGRQSLIDKMHEFSKRKSSEISNLRITDNDRYFYLKTTPEDEADKLYYRDGYEGKEIFLYDPQVFSSGTAEKYVISSLSPSFDGSKIAFKVTPSGSEISVLLTLDVSNKKLYPEKIDRCWAGGELSWLPDGNSYLYLRLQSSDVHDIGIFKDSKTYLHIIGTDPFNDKEIFSRSKYPELGIQPEEEPRVYYDKNSQYLYGFLWTLDKRQNVFYAPISELENDKINWKRLFKREDEVYRSYSIEHGSYDAVYNFYSTKHGLYVYSPKDAPNFKILKISLKNPDIANAEIIINEPTGEKLSNFDLTSDGIYYTIVKNGVEERLFYQAYGEKRSKEIHLPFKAGKINLRTKGFKFKDIWVTIAGWTNDYQRYRYLPKTNEFKLENLSDTAEFPEYSDLIVEEIMVESHDGVNVPLSLIYNKGIEKNGKNRVFFAGYGAYGYSMGPFFCPNALLWVNEGGILAFPHVRGGGELGDKWHKGGFKATKPNTWKDLIACAEYLIDKNYTSNQYIAIFGGSAGGILIGRALTERPDLFAVAIPMVGLLNPLRSEESPNGPVNVPEFGTVKDSVECMALIEMDAYLHLKDGVKYPATLISAGMNDPRVIAWQPAKFAARLQAVNTSDKPILFFTDYEAGHGIGDSKSKEFEGRADRFSFALWQTGHPKYQVK